MNLHICPDRINLVDQSVTGRNLSTNYLRIFWCLAKRMILWFCSYRSCSSLANNTEDDDDLMMICRWGIMGLTGTDEYKL